MKAVAAALGLALALVAAPVGAQPLDAAHVTNEPAATVFLPYFEVAVPKKIGGKPAGIDTIFSINNVSASAALVHVTIWSDLAVPVLSFNVYLTGYDVQPIDLFDVLNGHLPRTDFSACSGQQPYPDPLPVDTIDHLRNALTGKPSSLLGGLCAGRDFGEKKPIARGFVTADSVTNCTTRLPSDSQYFVKDVSFENILWGDVFFVDKSKKVGRGDALVHIRASQSDFEVSDFQYSFYKRISDEANIVAIDRRQPLATVFAGRFVNVPKHPFFPSGTSTIVWRDPKVNQHPFPCGGVPQWFPLGQTQIVVFDEQENPEVPALPGPPFPGATQIVKVGGPDLPVTPLAGWLYLDLNGIVPEAPNRPLEDPMADQAWVQMVLDSKNKYSVGFRAAVLDDAAHADHMTLPIP